MDIGAELFAMTAACVARADAREARDDRKPSTLADLFCLEARERIEQHFDQLFGANDPALYKLAMQVLRGEHAWLEQGIVSYVRADSPTRRGRFIRAATPIRAAR